MTQETAPLPLRLGDRRKKGGKKWGPATTLAPTRRCRGEKDCLKKGELRGKQTERLPTISRDKPLAKNPSLP